MWKEIEKIGPFVPRPKIPEEVNVNGNYVKKDTSVVLDKRSSEFMKLYRGIEYSDPDYDVNFLQQAISGVAFEMPSIDRESNEILNNPIAESEVQKHPLKTKTGKAVSVDCIPNEVLKNNMSIKMMTSMFNVFYNLGMIPLTWTQSILCLIYKGGQKDKREPLSYQPISLISNPCKIFSSVINDRLMHYLEKKCILVEEQNGFRSRRSCLDHIFVLTAVIRLRIQEKKSTFCCFVDFSKAFDFVNRNLLIMALQQAGIQGKFLSMIKVMYKETRSAIRINGNITDWFITEAGVRQGQNDSPTVFPIFINSLAKLLKDMNKGVKYHNISLTVLLYADDIIILADNENNMQDLLNGLHMWCKQWRMLINLEKTQIIHFRPKNQTESNYNFKVGQTSLNTVQNYRYLGTVLNEFLDFKVTGKAAAEGASRALGKLFGKYYANKGLGYRTYTKLFECCIAPIMDYASGVWGYKPNECLDKIQIRALRCYLGVNRYAPIAGVEGDLGWVTPRIRRQSEMLRLWNRLVSLGEERLPRQVYNVMMNKGHPWLSEIKELFNMLNVNDVPMYQF